LYISPENWENTFNDIDSLELTSPGKCTPECQEDLLMREVKVQEKQNEDIKSSNHEEQVIFKKPQTIEKQIHVFDLFYNFWIIVILNRKSFFVMKRNFTFTDIQKLA
jgi:hypothetical protein